MSQNIIPFYKNIGETPLEAIERYKKDHIEYRYLPMTYAGRLDPLVEGLLILLAGDECQKKDEYTSLSKEYELTILFGFATDTYDLLGKLTESSFDTVFPSARIFSCWKISLLEPSLCERRPETLCLHSLSETLKTFVGNIEQKYPPYSSRTVEGKPLWQWAREGKLGEIEIPSHEVMVHSIDVVEASEVSGKELLKKIHKVVPLVRGDFRQEEILSIWDKTLAGREEDIFPIVKIVVNAGSGTYMRVIANDIGEMLGIPALAYHIKRTKIGDFSLLQKES